METCVAKSSAAIVQRVPPEATEKFKQWQRDVSTAAHHFPGYEGTDLYPPANDATGEWVSVIHFADQPALQAWINSPERAKYVAQLRETVGDFELKTLDGGFSAWFASMQGDFEPGIPPWKMASTVLFGLYPTVMLLTIFVGPFTSPLGMSIAMLIGNAMSVALLQWAVVPALTRVLKPWLEANAPAKRGVSIAGLVGLLAILVGIAFAFRPITG